MRGHMQKQILLLFFLLSAALVSWPVAGPLSAQGQTRHAQTAPMSEVSIEHDAFFGNAPVYQAILRRDGTATYIGYSGVGKIGTYTAHISGFDPLAQAIRRHGFQNLKDEYNTTPISTDVPSVIVSVVSGGRRKAVSNHAGAGPQALQDIQTLIDQKVAAAHWKKVSSSTEFRHEKL